MAITNNNASRTITNTRNGGDLTTPNVATTTKVDTVDGNATTTTTTRTENGDTVATIINKYNERL
jgi:hypothetical protein